MPKFPRELNFDVVAVLVTALCFLVLAVKNLELPLAQVLVGTFWGEALTSKLLKGLIDVLCGGIIGAYAFYVMVEKLPTRRKEKQALDVLDGLIGTIVGSYQSGGIFEHEYSIEGFDLSPFEIARLSSEAVENILALKVGYMQLWSPVMTADSRYNEMCHALSLAIIVSPRHARQWLILLNKVRLLREELNQKPECIDPDVTRDIQNLRKYSGDETANHIWALIKRVMEFMREVKIWSELNNRSTSIVSDTPSPPPASHSPCSHTGAAGASACSGRQR